MQISVKFPHHRSAVVIFAVAGILAVLCFSYGRETSQPPANSVSQQKQKSQPMIIWWARLWEGLETFRLAVSSGVFSHVMLVNLHEFDTPREKVLADPNLREALKLCRDKQVTVIWTRWLYPGYNLRGFNFTDACKADYYIRRIKHLKAEAKDLGIGLVAFDAEIYAKDPLRPYAKRELSDVEFESLHKAIEQAVSVAGKVDFILPAGGVFEQSLYNCTSQLGKLTISEYTYYDIPTSHTAKMRKKRPYDIMGAHLGPTKKNPYHQHLPLFTASEILSKQYLWADTKGLFIYPGDRQMAAEVAEEFARIKSVYPTREKNLK